nr:F-box domain-containing protein [Tanacetum cinerariifolium]
MDGNNGWLKVMAFSDVEDDSKMRRIVRMTRNENRLAIGDQENDSFEKIDFEDFATSYSCLYNEGWLSQWASGILNSLWLRFMSLYPSSGLRHELALFCIGSDLFR